MSAYFQFGSFEIGVALAVTIGFVYVYTKRVSARPPLPPGPKGWPILGNFKDLPPSGAQEWKWWYEHKEKYGPISSVTMLGSTIVLVNSMDLAFELLEKRSAIYSARPRAVFAMEMCGWEQALIGQTKLLREYRKRMFEVVGTKTKSSKFNGLQDAEVSKFLVRSLEDPDHFLDHVRIVVGAIIIKLTYGYTIDTKKPDRLIEIAEKALGQFALAIVPGAWLVDTIPILRYLPEWMPGAGFKKTGREWNETLATMAETPIKFVKKQMAEKRNADSFVSQLYDREGGVAQASAEEHKLIKWAAASMYSAGADTSVGVLAIFFLGMLTHPAVEAKAQEEIDRVVGKNRLPTFEDRVNMPYIEAVFKEAFRWHTLAPLSLPHVCTKDDICEGYLIPKDAIIVPNSWWFSHDPAVYPNPETFDPTRYLGPHPAPDPLTFAFGYGRRACPGRQFADLNIWLTMVRSLAVFNVFKGRDENGNEIEPEVNFIPGIISHPVPYKATLRPRSPEHEYLIRQLKHLYPDEESNAAELELESV